MLYRQDYIIYLALGTNLGDRIINISNAITYLNKRIHILKQSPVYETYPSGYTNQPMFYNNVIKAKTSLMPNDLLVLIKIIEKQLGRKISIKNGPRIIDIDILFYGDQCFQSPILSVPHLRMQERDFVLRPLLDLEPNIMHPLLHKSVLELYDHIPRTMRTIRNRVT